jgi:predicted negative regulator of RcsB-dependent stress response
MQTQDAPAEIIFKLWPWLEANKNRLIGALAGIIVVAGIIYFISAHKEQQEVDAGQALTLLLVSPAGNAGQSADSFAQIATKYPGTAAGQRAQLQAGAAQFSAGNYADAQAQFQKLLDASSTGTLAATAALGVAASLEAQNKLDAAAAAYQKVTISYASTSCVLPAEFALGRIAEQQNKLTEAMNHYENAARAPLGGTLAQEASQRAFEIKNKLAAAPKAAVTPSAPPQPAAFTPVAPVAK